MAVPDQQFERQMPIGDEIFLDHVGYFTDSLEEAGGQLERLGFQVSGINVQFNNASDGSLVPTGTSNRLVKLERGFLEVLARTGDTALARQLDDALARYAGLHVIALTHPDMQAQEKRLTSLGLETQEIVEMRRRIPTPDGEKLMAYSILRMVPGSFPEGRLQLLTTHTPELFWTPGVTTHRNAAIALTDLLICVPDPAEAGKRFAALTGRSVTTADSQRTIALDRGRIVLANEHGAHAFLPAFDAPSSPYVSGQAIRTASTATTAAALSHSGIDPLFADDHFVCVGPQDALGSYLLFHASSIDDPWHDFARARERG